MIQACPNRERIRSLADSLDCVLEEDVCALSNWTPGTAKAHRKRGDGPPYIRFGRAYLYPKKDLASWLQGRIRERPTVPAKGLL